MAGQSKREIFRCDHIAGRQLILAKDARGLFALAGGQADAKIGRWGRSPAILIAERETDTSAPGGHNRLDLSNNVADSEEARVRFGGPRSSLQSRISLGQDGNLANKADLSHCVSVLVSSSASWPGQPCPSSPGKITDDPSGIVICPLLERRSERISEWSPFPPMDTQHLSRHWGTLILYNSEPTRQRKGWMIWEA